MRWGGVWIYAMLKIELGSHGSLFTGPASNLCISMCRLQRIRACNRLISSCRIGIK